MQFQRARGATPTQVAHEQTWRDGGWGVGVASQRGSAKRGARMGCCKRAGGRWGWWETGLARTLSSLCMVGV